MPKLYILPLDELKVNNAMIYYHFKDKEDLYRAVLADFFFGLNNIWNEEVFESAASTKEKYKNTSKDLFAMNKLMRISAE